jgi:hypothetical protein
MTTALGWLTPTESAPKMVEAGRVFVIRCVPDVFTGEVVNIGVCAIDAASGKRYAKVITDPGRLACFYGDSASNVVALAMAAGEAAQSAAASPSEQIIFDEPAPYYNTTAQDVLESTFAMQVTCALPQRPKSGEKVQITDDIARESALDAVKKVRQLQTDFIANTPWVMLNTDKGQRPVCIPLQPAHAVGTIRSADYGAESLRLHLLESVLDMEAAQRWRKKKAAGLFILRPTSHDKKQLSAIDKVIDGIAWRCNQSLHVEIEPTADALARKIGTWADAHA